MRPGFKSIIYKNCSSCLIVLLGLILTIPALASPLFLTEESGKQPIALLAYTSYFHDESGKWDLAKIRAIDEAHWQTISKPDMAFGFKSGAFWFRFTLTNTTSRVMNKFIEIAYPILDEIDSYVFSDDSLIEHTRMGDKLPFDHRPIDYQDFVIPIGIEPDQTKTVYIRVKTSSTMEVPLTLWDRAHFLENKHSFLITQGLYFGVILVMIFYNFFIYLVVRQNAYIYYVLSSFGIIFLIASLKGFSFQYLWPDYPSLNDSILILSISIYSGFACLFTISFLELKTKSLIFYRLISALAFLYLILTVAALTLSYQAVITYLLYLGIVTCLSEFSAGLYMFYKGLRSARYYLLAYSYLIIASLIIVLSKIDIISSNYLTENILQISSAIEVVLLSFALADRINQEKRQKIIAQRKALENESKAQAERERYLKLNYESHLEEVRAKSKLIELEAESRAKTKFLATMSHEIRTPMNGVLGMAELLKDTPLNKQQAQFVDIINSSGNALLNIINDILDYSKINAGNLVLENTEFDLEKLCLECISVFTYSAEQKNIDLIFSLQPGTPMFIKGDPYRLRQILLNLLGNACKFTSTGAICLGVKMIPSTQTGDNSKITLRFEIKDTGIGIERPLLNSLFLPFTQADDSTTRKYGGTGLGLSISKWLVELMGGEIQASSEPGQGSTFWFTILCDPATTEFSQPNNIANEALRSKRILIVDDSPDFARLIKEHTNSWGMISKTANSGEQALELIEASYARNEPYNFVVLDMNMPSTNGLECARTINSIYRDSAPQCILLTTIGFRIDDNELAGAGIKTAIQKPTSARVIKDTLLSLDDFNVELTEPTAGKSTHSLKTHSELADKCVLVVEDNTVNQLVITQMLKKMGIQPVLVKEGDSAIRYVKNHHNELDLVLMDCEMPVLDGFATTKAIRNWEYKNKLKAIPIFALTSHALEEYKTKARECGMNDHLSKPVNYSTIQEKLINLFQNVSRSKTPYE